MRNKLLLLPLLAALLPARATDACIHTSEATTGVAQSRLEAAVLYSKGREVLVMSSEITVGAQGPASLGWVTAVPTQPDAYGTVDAKFLKDLADFVLPKEQNSFGGDAGTTDAPSKGGIDIQEPVKAGPYTITAIKVSGADGVAALATWLKDNGYAALPSEISKYYADAGWTFLAVKVTPDPAQTALNAGVLPSLRIDFKSTDAVVPFKMEAGSPKFDSRVVLLTDGNPTNTAELADWGFQQPVKRKLSEVPSALTSQLGAIAPGMDFATAAAWQVLGMRAESPLNQTGTEILKWKTDFHLVMAAGTQPQPDAVGGDASKTTTTATTTSSSDGCGAAPVSGAGVAGLLAGLGLVALAVRRRRT
ncbi:MAG: DUF2330 domain-containing protein [Deltaproteobacteria bacterium]|nr:DUF2330 domain-containing protein [Deltaproteobacteria bacterium]